MGPLLVVDAQPAYSKGFTDQLPRGADGDGDRRRRSTAQ
jgi:hypothetical protein